MANKSQSPKAITVNLYYTGKNGSARKFVTHHASSMMKLLAMLRDKYDLHMKAERYIKENGLPAKDNKFIRQ